ncbi:MAG: exo-alpha-sialidase [Fimbriimonadaceae bacterium]|nr:exo-alpha-sialidase [Fimbriimonadaceae bacterium]
MLCLCLALTPALLAADVSERDGVVRNRLLSPGPGNPRNSEGDLLELTDGRLLLVYTHFTGGGADHATAHLASRVSTDQGRTWSDTDGLVLRNEGGQNVMSVTLRRMADDSIGLFYLRKNSGSDCRMYLRRSTDEGATWGEPTLCMPEVGYFVVNNDRVVRLRDGRLVVPASQHVWPPNPRFRPSALVCFRSDDDGRTWRRGLGMVLPPAGSGAGLQEPLVVERRDGRLWMLARTDRGTQWGCTSRDGGETWDAALPTSIVSPLSPAACERIPATGDLLLVWNDHRQIAPALRGKRTPLTVAVSRDDGATWSPPRTLEDAADGWYCYTAIAFVGSRVVLAHCAGDAQVGGLNRTQVTSFEVDWLYR